MDANKFFKIGVGSLAIVIAMYVVYLMIAPLVVSYYVMNRTDRITDQVHEPNKKVYVMDGIAPVMEPSSEEPDEEEPESVYIDIDTGNRMVTVHTGMSKDSVIALLGQPTEFDYNEYCDRITYRYGEYGSCKTEIEFKDGKVSCVSKRGTDIGKTIREASEN